MTCFINMPSIRERFFFCCGLPLDRPFLSYNTTVSSFFIPNSENTFFNHTSMLAASNMAINSDSVERVPVQFFSELL